MKTAFLSFVMLVSLTASAFASEVGFYFISGDLVGKKVESAGFIGYYDICFVGNPYEIRKELLSYMNDDIEKASSYVRIDKKRDVLIFGFVDTKCTDEGLRADQCREVRVAAPCK